jgi:hypothetical protein
MSSDHFVFFIFLRDKIDFAHRLDFVSIIWLVWDSTLNCFSLWFSLRSLSLSFNYFSSIDRRLDHCGITTSHYLFFNVCSVRNANQALCLRRVVDTTSTHFWFQCDFDFDTSFAYDTPASMILWMLDWIKWTKTFIYSTMLSVDDTMNKCKLLRNFSTSTRFHVLFCLIDTRFTSSVSVVRIDMWFDD